MDGKGDAGYLVGTKVKTKRKRKKKKYCESITMQQYERKRDNGSYLDFYYALMYGLH